MKSSSSTKAVLFLASQDTCNFSWWMPSVIQDHAPLEILSRPAVLDKDHTASGAVESFAQGVPQQSTRVGRWHLIEFNFGAFYSKNEGHSVFLQRIG